MMRRIWVPTAPARSMFGYFNPKFCYAYDAAKNYYTPQMATTTHTCTSRWSGNFLNWALTQTIDPMRKALTGGYRSIDTSSTTVLQKAYSDANVDTNGFPDKVLSRAATVSGATPFSWTSLTISNQKTGLMFNFSSSSPGGGSNPSGLTPYPGTLLRQAQVQAR